MRKFGNETYVHLHLLFGHYLRYCCNSIRLIFSIADIQNAQEAEFNETEEGEEGVEEDGTGSYPIRCSISITKVRVVYIGSRLVRLHRYHCKGANNGALTVDAMCQEGAFVADNISFYSDAKLATELTPEADWKRRGLYIGPQVDKSLR